MGHRHQRQQIAAHKSLATTVVLMLDADDAGAQAIRRAGALARAAGLEVLVRRLRPTSSLLLSCNATVPPR